MTDARDQDGGPPPGDGPNARPGFLPPVPPHDPQAGAARPADLVRPPFPGWAVARLVTAAILLLSAFLPWARAEVRLAGLGRMLDRELATEAGVNLDGTGQVVPVLAAVAIVMIVLGLLARDPRIGALAAVPALLALASCLIFLLRLDRFREQAVGARILLGGLDVTTAYGWYLSVASALLLTGLSLARRA